MSAEYEASRYRWVSLIRTFTSLSSIYPWRERPPGRYIGTLPAKPLCLLAVSNMNRKDHAPAAGDDCGPRDWDDHVECTFGSRAWRWSVLRARWSAVHDFSISQIEVWMGQRTGVIVQSTRAFCKRFRSDCLQSSQATSSMSEPTTDSIMLGHMSDERTCQANSLVVGRSTHQGVLL